jgi:hypothetical protein
MTPESGYTDTSAGRLQNLFVRLLFCDITYERYRVDRPSLARDFEIDLDTLTALPDPDAPQLIAERRGRKAGVIGEIRKTYAQSYELIEVLPGYSFQEFLCSDAFFDDAAGLPHPTGVGPGYESASKFFFWTRHTLNLSTLAADAPPDRLHARLMLNGDFAAYLIDQHNRGADAYYQRFANGVFWRESPASQRPVILMTAQLDVFRIGDDNQFHDMLAGAADLDDLHPEPTARAGNLI